MEILENLKRSPTSFVTLHDFKSGVVDKLNLLSTSSGYLEFFKYKRVSSNRICLTCSCCKSNIIASFACIDLEGHPCSIQFFMFDKGPSGHLDAVKHLKTRKA